MKKLILHIGMGKTGTSSLQHALSENITHLEEQGYSYIHPFSYAPHDQYQRGHSRLVHSLYENNNTFLEKYRNELLLLSEKFIPIVSAEGFFAFPERAFILGEERAFSFADKAAFVKKVQQYFSEHFTDIHVVVYLRRQDEIIQAWANQMSKRTLKFVATPEFIIEKMGLNLNYDRTLAIWEEYFGYENITLRIYEKSRLRDTVSDFCRLLGINGLQLPSKKDKAAFNPRISRAGVDYMNLMRSYNFPESLWKIISDTVWELSSEETMGYKKDHDLLSYNEKINILEKYEQSNRSLAARYLNNDPLFLDRPMNTPSSPPLDLEESMRITSSIFNRLHNVSADRRKPLSLWDNIRNMLRRNENSSR